MAEKIRVSGVICEFNPLHNGHAYLLSEIKKMGYGVVCVMSGNFVQRGEPAILDKWTRTKCALKEGADLVIELPFPWAVSTAEQFALGGISLLHGLGCVDRVTFGCETDDTQQLQQVAKTLLSPAFSQKLQSLQQDMEGLPFATVRQKAVQALLGEEAASLLAKPNAILGIEYCKAIETLGSAMKPFALSRKGIGHDEITNTGSFYAASQIRREIQKGNSIAAMVPKSTLDALSQLMEEGAAPASLSYLERPILSALRKMDLAALTALPDISEGLENRLFEGIQKSRSLMELYDFVKTKRYSHARVRRLVLQGFLGTNRHTLPKLPPYLRILGMTALGEQILKSSAPSLPVAARPADFKKLGKEAFALYQLEAKADDQYALALPTPSFCGRDYKEKMIRI